MNLLRSALAFFLPVIVALPVFAGAISLTKSDFSAAKEVHSGNNILITADFSPAGESKVKTLNQHVGQDIEFNIGGETHRFKLRVAIEGHQLQMGPFTAETAKKVVREINSQ